MTPAPMLRRYAAWSLDATLLAALVMALLQRRFATALQATSDALDQLAHALASTMADAVETMAPPAALVQTWLGDPALHAGVAALTAALTALLVPPMLLFALLSLPYFALFESSRWQATPGKRLLGLRVIDDDALAPGLVRAALRQAAGLLSWVSLNIGHAMAAQPPRHQALHDRIAGTRVVRIDDAPLPMFARLWLVLQPPACCLLLAWLLRVVDTITSAALDATLLR